MLKRSYFAAANGYYGFKSYFDNIFKSEKHKRVYVLKGGPGTGKSTLMKRITDTVELSGINYDNVHCSSDPSSLDGVIIYTANGNYTIVDGTAPHERDAILPGAIDTIINLGDNFDIPLLESRREEIINLNKKKKDAYNTAYSYLHIAGDIKNKINELITRNFNYEKALHIISTIKSFASIKDDPPQIALRRAFCKHGYFAISGFTTAERIFRISGKYGEELEFLRIFLDKTDQKYDFISLDPLCGIPDAIMAQDVSFICTSDQSAEFDAGECIKSTVSLEELDSLKAMHDSILSISQKHFERASILHAELEGIYCNAVDFSQNDAIANRIINDIL